MSNRVKFTSLSVHPEVLDTVGSVKDSLGLKSMSDAVRVLLAAYDIINGTGHGGAFTEAIKKTMEEDRI